MQEEEITDSIQKSRWLITGASGFIGRHLVEALRGRGAAVRVLIRDPSRLNGLKGTEVFRGDLTEPESLVGIEKGIDRVVHCAGLLGKWGVPERALYEVNVAGSLYLLERFVGRDLERFVHLSAGGVTGPTPAPMVDETCPCRPVTAYERAKHQAEERVLQLSERQRIPTVVVRPTFAYGPGDFHKLALFRALQRKRFMFIGNRDAVVTPVFIEDVVGGILSACERGQAGEVYLLGGQQPVSQRELIATIAEAIGVKCPKMAIPRSLAWISALWLEKLAAAIGFAPPLTRSRVLMMTEDYGYTSRKAESAIDYRPAVDLKKGIEKTVKAYRETGML